MAHSNQKRGRNQRRRPGQGNINKAMDSNGPDVKIRGTIVQIHDKYQNLARDAQSSGDRIRAESLLQHAEHYYRLMRMLQPKEQSTSDTSHSESQPSEKAVTADLPENINIAENKTVADKIIDGDAFANGQSDTSEVDKPIKAKSKTTTRKSSKQPGRKRAPRKSLTESASISDIQPNLAVSE